MFGSDFIPGLFAEILGMVYEDAVLETWDRSTRDAATGSFVLVKQSEQPVKIQIDTMTEEMRLEAGYSSGEILMRMVQDGVTPAPDADSRVRTSRGTFLVRSPITSDSFQTYWELRCRQNRV